MNDLLLDQVPLLRGLARALDEMAAGCAPAEPGAGALLLEQVHSNRSPAWMTVQSL